VCLPAQDPLSVPHGDTDPTKLVALLMDEKGIEVRIRKMK
jgi:hypothetical protein